MPIGEDLSPILSKIEDALWMSERDIAVGPPLYTDEGFRAAIKIFASAVMDKIWVQQEALHLPMEDRLKHVEEVGKEVRELIKKHTGIDPHDLYKDT